MKDEGGRCRGVRMLLLLVSSFILPPSSFSQTVGQWELRKKGATGMTSYGVTAENGKAIGFTADVPAMITVGAGTVTSVGGSFTGGLISVGGSPVTSSGTLALTVAGTSGGIPYFSSSTGWASSAALAANALVIGGGAGAAPATTTTGTGVLTALGVNTGSAGAIVLFNGALGTPSSGSGANLTSLNATNLASGTVDDARLSANVSLLGSSIALGSEVTGTLPIANGGTSGTTAATARVALLPSMAGNTLKVLRVNAGETDYELATVSSGITIGTTAITSGTATRLLYETAGNVVGEISGATSDGTTLTLVAPILGTPASATLTNASGLPPSGVVGTAAILGNNTFTGSEIISTNGADSSPPLYLTGALNVAGTGTTTFPHVFHQPTGATAATTWSSGANAGTVFGANETTGFVGNFADFRLAGTIKLTVDYLGRIVSKAPANSIGFGVGSSGAGFGVNNAGDVDFWSGSGASATFYAAWFAVASGCQIGFDSDATGGNYQPDAFFKRDGTAAIQMGADANADATDQTFKAADGITGTDKSGADMNLKSGLGTGAGAVSAVIFSTPTVLASGTTAQSYTERVRINSSGLTIGSGTAVSKVKHGTAVLVAGTVTVSDTDVVAGSRILINRQTDGGTLGDSYSVAITAATNFVIQSKTANANVAGDTSTVSWTMINP